MCDAGFSTADYKLAIHQLTELSKLLKSNTEQWSRLAATVHQDHLSNRLEAAAAAVAEATVLLESAFDEVHEHDHVHIS